MSEAEGADPLEEELQVGAVCHVLRQSRQHIRQCSRRHRPCYHVHLSRPRIPPFKPLLATHRQMCRIAALNQ